MNPVTTWRIATIPWYVFAVYWALSALRVKPTKAREKSADRLITMVVVICAYELLFPRWLRDGVLGMRFVPQAAGIAYAGIAITFVGTAISIWARYCLGEFWSARVALKEGHQLIRTGPYAFVRHPIYTGMLVATIGTALVVGEWRAVLAILLLVAAHSRKALREERMLTSEFGDEYRVYRQGTGFLFPRFGTRNGMGSAGQT